MQIVIDLMCQTLLQYSYLKTHPNDEEIKVLINKNTKLVDQLIVEYINQKVKEYDERAI